MNRRCRSCRCTVYGATGGQGSGIFADVGAFRSTLRKEAVGEQALICPKCGEVNSSNFLFCGMCGTMLEPARRAAPPVPPAPVRQEAPAVQAPLAKPVTTVAIPKPTSAPEPPVVERPVKPQSPVNPPPISIGGPSLLGLDAPSVETVRERSFSGLDSYGETDSRSRGPRILLLLVLGVGLGVACWWTYTNYMSATAARKKIPPPEAAQSSTAAPATSGSANVPEIEHENLPVRNTARVQPPVVTPDPPGPKARAKATKEEPSATTAHQVSASRLAPVRAPATDDGEGLFRQGERYLYGRGTSQDCDSAMKYMKMASDKQNAKARSALGTMYATGHCVSRDLPSAYRWFALSLRADPNNTVVEKNLSGVWNQMTPPERQLATRSGSQ